MAMSEAEKLRALPAVDLAVAAEKVIALKSGAATGKALFDETISEVKTSLN